MLPSTITLVTAILPLLALTSASAHSPHPHHLRHRRISNAVRNIQEGENTPRALVSPRDNAGHAQAKKVIKKTVKKRGGQQCRPRQAATTSFSAAVPTATSSSAVSSAAAPESSSIDNNQAWGQPQSSAADNTWTSSAAAAPASTSAAAPTSNNNNWSGSSAGGVLSISDGNCGPSNADANSPNGAEGWLNCGLDGAGWTPPMVTADQLIAAELSADGIFAPCGPYIDKFNQYAAQYGVKGIMLASFAMQESTCNPSATGGNGEAGLMQLASVNCGGAPGGNCYDIDFNIGRAAELFSNLIQANGGNVLLAIGSYNGWRHGLTIGDATAAASQGQCRAQNNLDYIHQYCNGWMQGKSGYELGSYCE
ncbi:hypothetical protein I302_100140 [Kwoniella bestiolae CBS 10118]|uniref:Transglycosylase SLT domain-containing protein n=1 Tax=Kwoniella bestiolae CBS 10118 TaxID=1296100 RepID=A0A1B9G4B4_9TREE|nr:transglycosylase SLT domain-containing protein [Kwoniella bestiolae CBS 10118]OCF25842.1 transglycosylase SLT domain-containing protein [Kwoniella bestiolae CBS 10118]